MKGLPMGTMCLIWYLFVSVLCNSLQQNLVSYKNNSRLCFVQKGVPTGGVIYYFLSIPARHRLCCFFSSLLDTLISQTPLDSMPTLTNGSFGLADARRGGNLINE
jgi:hypothetical protein